jgi:hypothetical protein
MKTTTTIATATKPTRFAVFAFVIMATLAAAAQSGGQKSFDAMKSLNGNWEGKDSMGEPVQVSFRPTAGGSAIMSEIQTAMKGHSEDMVTMIHMDGDHLLLTHYCAAGNQPRMQASASADGKTITFNFLDATNLASPDAGHMHRVVFTFVDANHHTEDWQFQDHDKQIVAHFELQKKS